VLRKAAADGAKGKVNAVGKGIEAQYALFRAWRRGARPRAKIHAARAVPRIG